MGLFDFATNFGNNIFGGDDDAETAGQKLQAHIEEDNPGVEGLQVSVEDGVATITGEAESSSAYEKAVLMAGNALGVGSVEAGGLSVSEQIDASIDASEDTSEQIPTQTIEVDYYQIKKGDTLWKIANQFYGDGSKYKTIFEENREVIKDPDKIFEGQKIRIPVE
jgi:nucleoid-associated protein YgaU